MASEWRIDISKQGGKVKFDPNPLEVSNGDLIFWANHDDQEHWPGRLKDDGTILQKFFMRNELAPNGDTSPLFATSKAGTLSYACSLHVDEEDEPVERGTIKVTE